MMENMQAYFDIHSHILPGVDDGAKDMDDTRRMLYQAYKEGLRIIVATPHYVAGKENRSVEQLKQVFEQVKQTAHDISDELELILGNELFYNLEMVEALAGKSALTIDGTRYILVEFLPDAPFRKIWEGINHCIFAGYIPILAHAERYRCLLRDYSLVGHLIESGAYIQLNYSAILRKGPDRVARFCRKLLKKSWVHFLGTDMHNPNNRAPCARRAFTFLKMRYGASMARQLLWENPMTMIEDKHL